MIPKWNKVPQNMQNEYVKYYYNILRKKSFSLACKRLFDIVVSLIMIILLSPVLIAVAIWVKVDSKGPVLYRQERVTQYGRIFRVCKFRTMVDKADQMGSHVTVEGDARITKVGQKIRNCRLDELPQLFNVLGGSMSFVGTRPEAVKYVRYYTEEMMAVLLLPAGITSKASIMFKDEAEQLMGKEDVDKAYVEEILPEKMKYNLESLKEYGFFNDIKIMFETVIEVLK
jgi:lipopolysaccharide/colanic/teichoic acid biosynthesis glycosyltransferase